MKLWRKFIRTIVSFLLCLSLLLPSLYAGDGTGGGAAGTESEKEVAPLSAADLKYLEAWIDGITKNLISIARDAEKIDKRVERFGSISMSAPLLNRPTSEKVDGKDLLGWPDSIAGNDGGDADFFDMEYNNVQGYSAQRYATSNRFVASASMGQNPIQAEQYQFQRQEFDQNLAARDANREILQQSQATSRQAAELRLQTAIAEAELLEDPLESQRAQATALDAYATELSTLAGGEVAVPGAPTFPTVDPAQNPVPSVDQGTAIGDVEKLSALLKDGRDSIALPKDAAEDVQGLIQLPTKDDGSPRISTRQALIAAAGSHTLENIFRMFHEPELLNQFKDKITLMSVVSIAVNPGFQTSEGYSAQLKSEVTFSPRLARPEVREAALNLDSRNWSLNDLMNNTIGSAPGDTDAHYYSEGAQPLVAAISPMMETEMWEYQDSLAKQREIAILLSGALSQAGLQQQGSVFNQWVSRLDKQTRQRTPNVIVNTLNTSGGIFGFEVGPRLKAVNPTEKKSKPEMLLERQSFPALLLVGLDPKHIRPYIDGVDDKGEKVVMERMIKFAHYGSWVRLAPNDFSLKKVVNPIKWGSLLESEFWHRDRVTLPERIKGVAASGDVWTDLRSQEVLLAKLIARVAETKPCKDFPKYAKDDVLRRLTALGFERKRLANIVKSNDLFLNGSAGAQYLPLELIVKEDSAGARKKVAAAKKKAESEVLITSFAPQSPIIAAKGETRNLIIELKGKGLNQPDMLVEAVGSATLEDAPRYLGNTVYCEVKVSGDEPGEFFLYAKVPKKVEEPAKKKGSGLPVDSTPNTGQITPSSVFQFNQLTSEISGLESSIGPDAKGTPAELADRAKELAKKVKEQNELKLKLEPLLEMVWMSPKFVVRNAVDTMPSKKFQIQRQMNNGATTTIFEVPDGTSSEDLQRLFEASRKIESEPLKVHVETQTKAAP